MIPCECGTKANWYADNNGGEGEKWYCDECENNRAMRYGCAMIVEEGCGCYPNDPCACGCDGTGVYKKEVVQ